MLPKTPATATSLSREGSVEEVPEEHIQWRVGQTLGDRFVVHSLLGEGTFGRVLEAKETKSNTVRAVKVVKPYPQCIKEAKIEAKILQKVQESDPYNEFHILRLVDTFSFNKHFCLVFERLGKSLYDLLERNRFRGFQLAEIQSFAVQILESLSFMSSIGLTHTDLKPENILFVNDNFRYCSRTRLYRPVSTEIKIIDFGGATFEDEHHSSVINTRHYRAPEVILQQGWGTQSDMWSVGCILVELYTGEPLFPFHNDYAHLALMEKLLGRIPVKMTRNLPYSLKRYFNDKNQLVFSAESEAEENYIKKSLYLEELIPENDFRDFIAEFLKFIPERRITPAEALNHRFLSNNY